VTDGYQTSIGQTQPGGHDHGTTPTPNPTPAPVNLGTASFAISGVAAVGQTLTATQSANDPNGQGSGGYSYQWQASGDGGLSWSAIGTNASSLVLSSAVEGQSVRLKVAYTDAANFAETVFTAAQSVAFVNDGQARFSLTGTGAVGQPITASETHADPDGDGTFAYQWQAQPTAGGAWQAITGANSTSFVPASAQQGQSLRLQVNYQDRQGFAETVYSGTVAVPLSPVTPTPTPTPVLPILDPGGAIKPAVPITSSPFLKVSVGGTLWYHGLTAQITVTNTGTTALGSWSLTFDTTHQLSGAPWGASLSQVNLGGGLYRSTLSGKDWATSLAAGASVNVGFNATQGLSLGDAGTLTGPALFSTSAAQLAATTGNPTYQSGDGAANVLKTGSGADQLTGLAGSDVFRVSSPGLSLLGALDRITDFSVGVDSLDGLTAVAADQMARLGAVSALSEAGIASLLTATSFGASGAATFTFGSGSTARTFVALNDGVAGFQATADTLLEITGYAGDLRGLAVI
ncbi:MAG: cellulose binding domain-containing protein, partial [Cyanobacteria bacterium]|nr:cellulose binding domain-containing protein [Cyanobacteriota bacterium]